MRANFKKDLENRELPLQPIRACVNLVHGTSPLPHFGTRLCWDIQGKLRLAFPRRLRYQLDMSDESVENIARKLAEAVPEGLRSVREDLESNFRSVLRASLAKLDLVTREEFEVQEAVLAKTRQKLEALEARLEDIEKS